VLCDNEFQTKGALTLKALVDNESAILGTDSNTLTPLTYRIAKKRDHWMPRAIWKFQYVGNCTIKTQSYNGQLIHLFIRSC